MRIFGFRVAIVVAMFFPCAALAQTSQTPDGARRFLALYLLSGLGGSLASYAFSPAPAVGASGAIFGLIGGLIKSLRLSTEE